MGIGRVSPRLYDAIEDQINRRLRKEKIDDIRKKVETVKSQTVYVRKVSTDSSVANLSNPVVNEVGYNYSVTPPVYGVTYESSQDRIDNIDTLLLSILADIDYLQNNTGSFVAVDIWERIEYVASGTITSINLPSQITDLKLWKNGLRMMSGSLYDYTFSGSRIYIGGISGDRFIIEYTTNGAGS